MINCFLSGSSRVAIPVWVALFGIANSFIAFSIEALSWSKKVTIFSKYYCIKNCYTFVTTSDDNLNVQKKIEEDEIRSKSIGIQTRSEARLLKTMRNNCNSFEKID